MNVLNIRLRILSSILKRGCILSKSGARLARCDVLFGGVNQPRICISLSKQYNSQNICKQIIIPEPKISL